MGSEVIAYPDKMSFDSDGQSVYHSDAGNRIDSKSQREAILRQNMFSVADDLQDHQGPVTLVSITVVTSLKLD